ncbi:unnamed protein product, partial [Amoebophrya sp. A25]|eukprot:GSA25T00015128001.1
MFGSTQVSVIVDAAEKRVTTIFHGKDGDKKADQCLWYPIPANESAELESRRAELAAAQSRFESSTRIGTSAGDSILPLAYEESTDSQQETSASANAPTENSLFPTSWSTEAASSSSTSSSDGKHKQHIDRRPLSLPWVRGKRIDIALPGLIETEATSAPITSSVSSRPLLNNAVHAVRIRRTTSTSASGGGTREVVYSVQDFTSHWPPDSTFDPPFLPKLET